MVIVELKIPSVNRGYRRSLAVNVASASLTQSVQHKPRALLRDANLFRQCGVMRPLEDGSRSDSEIQLASVAAIETTLAFRDWISRLTSRAGTTIVPKSALGQTRHLRRFQKAEYRCSFQRGDLRSHRPPDKATQQEQGK